MNPETLKQTKNFYGNNQSKSSNIEKQSPVAQRGVDWRLMFGFKCYPFF